MKHRNHPRKPAQRGITLIEALISLLLLALGVLGLAVVQARMLVETRTTNSRATAIRLIADLGDRIRANAAGAQPQPGSPNSPYADTTTFQVRSPTSGACDHTVAGASCSPADQAKYDVWAWRKEVEDNLMNGRASIAQVDSRQLQVIVAWQANENANTTITAKLGAAAPPTPVASALQITNATTKANLCVDPDHPGASNWICHVDFIDIPNTP